VKKDIGYTFHDETLLEDALTRQSYISDNHIARKDCMDPLATLGDAVLSCVVAFRLYNENNLTKQKITELRSEKVRRERTRAFTERNHLGDFINWGKGEQLENVAAKGYKAYDTVTEALIGAVFLDAQNKDNNGFNKVNEMLGRLEFFN